MSNPSEDDRSTAPPHTAGDLPAAFGARLERQLAPADLERVLVSMAAPKRTCFRVLPPRVAGHSDASGEQWDRDWQCDVASRQAACDATLATLRAMGLTPEPFPLSGDQAVLQAFTVPAAQRDVLTHSAPAAEAAIYIQNPSSMLAVAALDPQPGDEVLDLAAAPGGKTLLMAERMGDVGRIAAVEPVKGRFHRLRDNVARVGARCVDFYCRDGREVGRRVQGRFDRVLLDAPCSSEARFRVADAATHRHWSERKVQECARKQRGLIASAFQALKPGGRLVYCTCSFAPEENELVVARLLARQPTARLVEVAQAELELAVARSGRQALVRAGLSPAQLAIVDGGRKTRRLPPLGACVRILPDDCFDGFFLAVIEKAPDAAADAA